MAATKWIGGLLILYPDAPSSKSRTEKSKILLFWSHFSIQYRCPSQIASTFCDSTTPTFCPSCHSRTVHERTNQRFHQHQYIRTYKSTRRQSRHPTSEDEVGRCRKHVRDPIRPDTLCDDQLQWLCGCRRVVQCSTEFRRRKRQQFHLHSSQCSQEYLRCEEFLLLPLAPNKPCFPPQFFPSAGFAILWRNGQMGKP